MNEEERARAKACFTSWRNGDGTTGFRGKLPDVQADMLLELLHGYANPRRRANPTVTTSQPDDTRHPKHPKPSKDPKHPKHPKGATPFGSDDDLDPDGRTAAAGGPAGSPAGGCDGSARDGCCDAACPEQVETGKTIPYPVRLRHAAQPASPTAPWSAATNTSPTTRDGAWSTPRQVVLQTRDVEGIASRTSS